MLPSESPFSNSRELPELPFVLNGSFDWLLGTNSYDDHIGHPRRAKHLSAQLKAVRSSAAQNNLMLPAEFVEFMGNSDLHRHLRSVTDSYLSIAESILPLFDGYLVRFLADSQGVAFWYLYLNSDGSDHCVVMSYEYFDAFEMDYEVEEIQESDFEFEAESFEAFLCRFWLTNEIGFAEEDGIPLPDVEPRLLELYSQY